MKRDDNNPTYRTVRDRYARHDEANPRPESESAIGFPQGGLPIPELSDAAARTLALVIAVGVGLGLLALAGVAFATAREWAALDRSGAATGYTLVIVFLLIAGVSAIAATLNHHFGVLRRQPEHH